MARSWLEKDLQESRDVYDDLGACIVKCSECKRLLDHVDFADSGRCPWTSKARTKFYFLEWQGKYRCGECGVAKQVANNAKLAMHKPQANVAKCMICDVYLVHPGRKTPELEINCSRNQWAKGDGDRRCIECAEQHKDWHEDRKRERDAQEQRRLRLGAGADSEAEACASSGRV